MMTDNRNRLHDILTNFNKLQSNIHNDKHIKIKFYNILLPEDKETITKLSLFGYSCNLVHFINKTKNTTGYCLHIESSNNKMLYTIPVIKLSSQSLKEILLEYTSHTKHVGASKIDIHQYISKKQINNRKMIYLSLSNDEKFNKLNHLRIIDPKSFEDIISTYDEQSLSELPENESQIAKEKINKNQTLMVRNFYLFREMYNILQVI